MVKFAMFIIRLLKHPIKWCGANYEQVEAILKTKLAIDFRQVLSRDHASGKSSNVFRVQLAFNLLIGMFISVGFIRINNLLLNLTICFSMIMVVLGLSIIAGYSSVLFDHRDNHILLVRPISNRTLLIARLLHIQVYLGYIAIALGIIPSIVINFKHGLFALFAFWIAVGLCSWTTLLLTLFLYMALSNIVSGERFKDTITYLQIFMSILIFGGYQLLPRMIGGDALKSLTLEIHWWTYLIPPLWLAGFVDFFSGKAVSLEIIILALLALFVSIAGAMFMVRYLSRGFVDVLSEGAAEKVEKEDKVVKSRTQFSLCRLFCVSKIEQMGWKLAMSITKRDRKFKQAVYPSFGIIIVLAIVIIKPDFSSLAATMEKLSGNKSFILFFFAGLFGTNAIGMLPYTDTPEGAWIYRALPIKNHGHILTGAIKAMLFKFFGPIIFVFFAITLAIWGASRLPGLVIGCLLIILINQYSIIFTKMSLPFTQARDMQQTGSFPAMMFFRMIFMGAAIGLVYLVLKLNIWIVVGICIVLFLMVLNANRQIRKRDYILS